MFNQSRNIFNFLLLSILLLLLPISLNTFIPIYYVSSNSMAPEISKGNLIVVSNDFGGKASSLLGEVVVFLDPLLNRTTVHRVISYSGNFLSTKGDRNFYTDLYQPSVENIYGRVIWTISPRWEVLGFVVVGGALILALFLIIKIKRLR